MPFNLKVKKTIVPEDKNPYRVVAKLECSDEHFLKRLENILPDNVVSYRDPLFFEKIFTRNRSDYHFIVCDLNTLGLVYASKKKSLVELLYSDGLQYESKSDEKMDSLENGLRQVLDHFLNKEYEYFLRLKSEKTSILQHE